MSSGEGFPGHRFSRCYICQAEVSEADLPRLVAEADVRRAAADQANAEARLAEANRRLDDAIRKAGVTGGVELARLVEISGAGEQRIATILGNAES